MRTSHAIPAHSDAEATALLPAARLVPTTTVPLRTAKRLAVAFAAFLLFAALAPWRQTVSGTGQVYAFAPDERPQPIEATISGVVVEWHAVEGQMVREGDLLVELADNDPERVARLEVQRDASVVRVEAYVAQVEAFRERMEALRRSQEAQLGAARAEVRVVLDTLASQQELLVAAEARVTTNDVQQVRVATLAALAACSPSFLATSST